MVGGVGAQLRKGVIEYCVLGLLAGAPMYGWELASALMKNELIASIGTLYPVLGRLRNRGLIEPFARSTDVPGPVRKYYRLTRAGDDELAAFRSHWPPFTKRVNELVEGEGA